jgi:broad specificity phosphatase PhoE
VAAGLGHTDTSALPRRDARYGRPVAQLLLVRHAQSEWNAAGRWQGWADPPLTPHGLDQAREAGTRLAAEDHRFDVAVSSDLDRARTTAAVVAGIAGVPGGVETAEVPGLRELDVGQWSGLSREQIAARWPEALADWRSGQLEAAPGGEARSTFDRRVRETLLEVVEAHPDACLLVVAHGGVVRSVARWLDAPQGPVQHLAGFWLDHGPTGTTIAAPVDLLAGGQADDSAAAR